MALSRRLLPAVIAPALLLAGVSAVAPGARQAAHAQVSGSLNFTPNRGGASIQRLVEFSGFRAGETVDLAFTSPLGVPITVSGYTTFLASAQDDGTGAFFFRPSDWLDVVSNGQWTVTITGESSGASVTTTFFIDGN